MLNRIDRVSTPTWFDLKCTPGLLVGKIHFFRYCTSNIFTPQHHFFVPLPLSPPPIRKNILTHVVPTSQPHPKCKACASVQTANFPATAPWSQARKPLVQRNGGAGPRCVSCSAHRGGKWRRRWNGKTRNCLIYLHQSMLLCCGLSCLFWIWFISGKTYIKL